jgi:hypothetical protein
MKTYTIDTDFDSDLREYIAFFDGYDGTVEEGVESDPIGHGDTETEAMLDLLDQSFMRECLKKDKVKK